MSTSAYEYRILMDTDEVCKATNALDALTTRFLINNANHLADEFAQVVTCMSSTVAAISSKVGYLTPRTPTLTATPYAIVSHTFPIKVRAAGQSYRFRIRIGGASGSTASTKFYAVLSRANAAIDALAAADDAVFETAATTSSTAAWLTGTSMGDEGYTTMIEMTAAQVALCSTVESTLTDLAGSSVSVTFALATLSIFATTANVAHVPRLYAVSCAEVIGT